MKRKNNPELVLADYTCHKIRKHKGNYSKDFNFIGAISVKRMLFGNDFGVFIEYKDSVAIVFAGSDDLDDWKDNIDCNKVDVGEDIWIHEGFYDSSKKFFSTIGTYLSKLNKKIFVYGHSKGGAIAKIVSWYLATKLKYKVNCITFGAPRVGGRTFRESFNLATIWCLQVRLKKDPVWKLPLHIMGYKSVGQLMYLRSAPWNYLPGMGIAVHLSYHKRIGKLYESK